MFNTRGGRGRGRGRGKNNNDDDNKNNNEDVQCLVDYLAQNVIRKRRTTTPKKNLGLGHKRAFNDITEVEANFFKDVEEADDLPENFEALGPIPNSVSSYTFPLDVACHRFNKKRRSNDDSKRRTSRKENEVISAEKEKDITSNFNSEMATVVSDQSSVGFTHVQDNGTGTSSSKSQESNFIPNPRVLYDIPEPIPYNLGEIMIDQSLGVNFWATIY